MTAKDPSLIGKTRADQEWERAEMLRPRRRTRLQLSDFENIGIDLARELMIGLKKIEDPKDYMRCLFEIMSYITPKINPVDLGPMLESGGQQVDLNTVPTSALTAAAREKD